MMGAEKDKQDQRHGAFAAMKVDSGDGANPGHKPEYPATVSDAEIGEPTFAKCQSDVAPCFCVQSVRPHSALSGSFCT